jgi:hypothetical protein
MDTTKTTILNHSVAASLPFNLRTVLQHCAHFSKPDKGQSPHTKIILNIIYHWQNPVKIVMFSFNAPIDDAHPVHHTLFNLIILAILDMEDEL